MITLGIESSCDETAVAVVQDGWKVLSSVVASQIDIHKVYGGVIPEIAAREHLASIDHVYREALKEAELSLEQVDAVAVTQGPGLLGALLVGVTFAKGLAYAAAKPLIPVDHIHGHVYSAFLDQMPVREQEDLPALVLVASGGHTQLFLFRSSRSIQMLGQSLDDACGECFDKIAKIMGLPYPGGPEIERLAQNGDPEAVEMPRPLVKQHGPDRLNFSFSGLKTHMLQKVQSAEVSGISQPDLAASFQKSAIDQLIRKIDLALQDHPSVRSLLVVGGVSANKAFRKAVDVKQWPINVVFPKLKYCSDNAAMIAARGASVFRVDDRNAYMKSDWDAYSRYGSWVSVVDGSLVEP